MEAEREGKLFPIKFLENNSSVFLFKLSKKTLVIYKTLCVLMIISLISIFFIKVNVTVKAKAIIKPFGEKVIITSPITGIMNTWDVRLNNIVKRGDTLALINTPKDYIPISSYKERVGELRLFILDLDKIINSSNFNDLVLFTDRYNASLKSFLAKYNTLVINNKYIEKDYNRNKMLYSQKVIALVEFERLSNDYEKSHNDILSYKNEYLSQLEVDIVY